MIEPSLLSCFLLSIGCADKGTCCLQNLNILTVGAKDGKGGFFPEGIAGRINTPEGFNALAEGIEDWDGKAEAIQVSWCHCKPCTTAEGCRLEHAYVLCCRRYSCLCPPTGHSVHQLVCCCFRRVELMTLECSL